jgi:hypothetical protein
MAPQKVSKVDSEKSVKAAATLSMEELQAELHTSPDGLA